jgi:hypothetical protein
MKKARVPTPLPFSSNGFRERDEERGRDDYAIEIFPKKHTDVQTHTPDHPAL